MGFVYKDGEMIMGEILEDGTYFIEADEMKSNGIKEMFEPIKNEESKTSKFNIKCTATGYTLSAEGTNVAINMYDDCFDIIGDEFEYEEVDALIEFLQEVKEKRKDMLPDKKA